MKGSLLLVAALLPGLALAQTGDEWTNFPANPPPANQPKAQPQPGATPEIPVPPKTKPAPAPASPAAPAAAPQPTPAPAAAEPPPPHQDPNARSRVEERLRAAEQGKPIPQNSPDGTAAAPGTVATPGTDPGKDLPVVSRQEKVLPGTEHHSPSTWGHGLSDNNDCVTVGAVGISVLHTQSPILGPKGVLRFSALGEYTNLSDFPVKSAQDIRSSGTFAASFVPIKWVEAYIGYSATANTNSRTSPNLIQALGDLTLGAKGAFQISEDRNSPLSGLYLGADLRLLTYSAVGNQSIDRFAVGFAPAALVAYDMRAISKYAPIIAHMNLGVTLDSTGGLVTNQTLNASEEFALSINRYNRFNFALAAEVPLPVVAPFIEYSLASPLGVPGGQLTGPDGVKVDASAAMPQKLGLGFKVTAIKDLTVLTAFDIGLSRSVGLGIAATTPWNFLLNFSFNIDPFQRGETKLVETVRERPVEKKVAEAPKTGKVEGIVVDAKTHAPISGVLVAMVGLGLPPVASDAEAGRFLTYDLPVGPVKLHASRDGYKEIEQELKIELGKPQKVELTLEPVEKKAIFAITVVSKKKPIAASVVFHGTAGGEDKAAATADGVKDPVKVEMPASPYSVVVTAEGYLAQNRDVQISAGAEMELAFDLQPAPKKMLAIIKDDKIEISQQVHFLTGKATILADSYSLLQQVVDVMVRNNVKRVRVEGHTDNRGDKAFNQKLSEDRAKSVGDYLVAQGIDRSRIESAGYGDTKPVAPNLTARGRELNRRVEFLILEK